MNTSYSQNGEDLIIEEYFKTLNLKSPRLLDLGANDGITLSNSYKLLKSGKWHGVLVEPSVEAYRRLQENLKGLSVTLLNFAIGTNDGVIDFMESGAHFSNGADIALVSTISETDYNKWKHTTSWKKYQVNVFTIDTLFSKLGYNTFDFVSMDIEGMDLHVLKQMDLSRMEVKCMCVEHNGKDIDHYVNYCQKYGLIETSRNAENIIFIKK